MANDLINHAYMMEHPYTPKQWDLESLCVGEHIHVPGRWHTPNSTETEAPALGILLDLTLCTSSSGWSFISFITSFIVNW